MSRILRRPMFRGGSTSNEGIMSVPRKGYEKAGGVQDFDVSDYYPSSSSVNGGLFGSSEENEYTPAGITISDSGIDLNKIDNITNKTIQNKNVSGEKLKNLSASDILMAEYLGNRPDPLGKFLINFGLNYMSARPRGGKLGALTTAADAAKKPTEQLYADIDTDRLLKLKLMSALGKSETAGSFEKRVKAEFKYDQELPEGQRRFKTISDAAKYVSQLDILKKATTPEERIAAREKSFETDQPGIKRVKATLFELGIPKLGKEEKNVDLGNTFIGDSIKSELVQKPNSTDAQIATPPQNIDKIYKVGKIYIDINSRNAYKYAGSNTFRFVQSLE